MQAKVNRMQARGRWTGGSVAAALVALAASTATAEVIPRDEGFMKPPKSVAHRIFSLDGKTDLGFAATLSIKNRLTEHYGAMFGFSKQFSEYLAFDALVGGGYGGLTNLAERVRETVRASGVAAGDLADAGSLLATAQLGLRLTPFYGKVSLAAELPVHFNLYFNAGVGGVLVRYDSVLTCAVNRTGTVCPGNNFASETKPNLGLNVGGGFRFYANQNWSARLEMRAIAYPDQWRENVNLKQPVGAGAGTPATDPGWTWVPLFLVGVGYVL